MYRAKFKAYLFDQIFKKIWHILIDELPRKEKKVLSPGQV